MEAASPDVSSEEVQPSVTLVDNFPKSFSNAFESLPNGDLLES